MDRETLINYTNQLKYFIEVGNKPAAIRKASEIQVILNEDFLRTEVRDIRGGETSAEEHKDIMEKR
jgi:hypothetical protein